MEQKNFIFFSSAASWKWYNYELRTIFFTLMYLSCSYICTTYIPNKFAYLQSESNCKLPRIRPSWYAVPAVFKIFFFLRYAIFLARLNNFQSVSMRTFCRVLTLHYIWHFFVLHKIFNCKKYFNCCGIVKIYEYELGSGTHK